MEAIPVSKAAVEYAGSPTLHSHRLQGPPARCGQIAELDQHTGIEQDQLSGTVYLTSSCRQLSIFAGQTEHARHADARSCMRRRLAATIASLPSRVANGDFSRCATSSFELRQLGLP